MSTQPRKKGTPYFPLPTSRIPGLTSSFLKKWSHVRSSFIGDITWSDHATIGIQFSPRTPVSHSEHWKLNLFLIADPKNAQAIEEAHRQYFLIDHVNGMDKFTYV